MSSQVNQHHVLTPQAPASTAWTRSGSADLPDDVHRRRRVSRRPSFAEPPNPAAAWVPTVDEPHATVVRLSRPRADLVVQTTADRCLSISHPKEQQR